MHQKFSFASQKKTSEMTLNDARNETSQSSGRVFSHVDSLEKQVRYGAQFKTFKYALT